MSDDPTLKFVSALATRVEAQEQRIAALEAHHKNCAMLHNRIGSVGDDLYKRIAALEADLKFIHQELSAHLHSPRMHGGPGGPRHLVAK